MCVVSCAQCRRAQRLGTTTRYVRERRGTTPLAALSRGRSITAVTGLPVRFY